jgi:DNA-directed RNA polymerase omega subunit
MNDKYLARALEKIPDRRALSLLASRRARQLVRGARPLIKSDEDDYLNQALLEIAEGLLDYELPIEDEEDEFGLI